MKKFIIVPNSPACYPQWTKQEGYSKQVDYKDRKYRLEKHYRKFSCGELFLRRVGGLFAAIFTGGLALCSKKVLHLFIKKRKVVRFGIPVEKSATPKIIPAVSIKEPPTAYSVPYHEDNVQPIINDMTKVKEKLFETPSSVDLQNELPKEVFKRIFNSGIRVASKIEDKHRIVDALCDLFRAYINKGSGAKSLSSFLTVLTYEMFDLQNYYQWNDEKNKSIFNCTTWTNAAFVQKTAPFCVCKNYNNLPNIFKPFLELLIFNGADLQEEPWRLNADKKDIAAVESGIMDKNFNECRGPFNVFQGIKAHHLTRLELTKMVIAEIKAEQQLRTRVLKEEGAKSPLSPFNTLPKEVIDLILKFSY